MLVEREGSAQLILANARHGIPGSLDGEELMRLTTASL